MSAIRLRLAPSPTGFLHLGNLRTAVFGYLMAKKLGGQFILRIEDTDDKRYVEGAVESLIDILGRLDIKFDEGPIIGGNYGPYVQTERLEIYQRYARELVEKGEAYYCFCSSERLEELRAEQTANHQPPRYDRACRDLSLAEADKRIANGEAYVIRQKMPLTGEITVTDALRGNITFPAADLDDQVLMKSNGIPTYQLANVIDDHLMAISHVTRGAEWLPSFPKNILLYQAFGWTPPEFIHLPLILNKTGGKLSKRQGDVFVEQYLDKGYLPIAIINFCSLLGWHPQGEQEIFNSWEELIEQFDYHKINTSPAIFDPDKFLFLSGYHIRQLSIEKLTELLIPFLQKNQQLTAQDSKKDVNFSQKVAKLYQERLRYLSEIGELSHNLYLDQLGYEDPSILIWKKSDALGTIEALKRDLDFIKNYPENNWKTEQLLASTTDFLKNNGLAVGDHLWPWRVALSGLAASPSPFELADILGKNETIKRLEKALEAIQAYQKML
ncbi:MAG TPA: glutamate--tRNA ligase [bacterium]|nr:glutamate--tRNA ligase [bacterium]